MRDAYVLLDVGQEKDVSATQQLNTDPSRLNRHRGLWSFLTRSFFLGQMIVALPALGRAAKTSYSDGDLDFGSNTSTGTSASTDTAAAPLLSAAKASDADISNIANTVPAAILPSAPPPPFSAVDVSPAGSFQTPATGATSQGSSTLITPGDAVAQGALPYIDVPGQPSHSGEPVVPSPGGNPGETIVETVVITTPGPVETVVETVVVSVPESGETIVETVETVPEIIETIIETVVETVIEPVLDIVDDVGSIVEDVLESVDETVDVVAELVVDTVDTLLETVEDTVEVVFDVLQDVSGSLPLVGPALTEVIELLEDVITPTLEAATSVVGDVVDVVTDTLNEVGDVFSALGDAIGSDVIPALTDTVSDLLTDPLGTLSELDVTDLIEPVEDVVASVVSVAETLFVGVGDVVTDSLPTLVEPVLGIVNDAGAVVEDVHEGVDVAIGLVAEAVDDGVDAVVPLLEETTEAGLEALEAITAIVPLVGSDLPEAVDGIAQEVVSTAEDGVSNVASVADTLLDGIGNLSFEPESSFIDPLLEIVEDVGTLAGGLLEDGGHAVETAAEIADDSVDTLLSAVGETSRVVEGITSEVPLVGSELTDITDVVDEAVSPAVEAVTSLAGDIVADAIADAGSIFSGLGEAIGSDVVPALSDAVADVFASPYMEDGIHTDLGVVLQSDILAPIEDVISGVGSTTETLLDGLDDLAGGDSDPIGSIASVLTNPLGGFAGFKGGFVDLFG